VPPCLRYRRLPARRQGSRCACYRVSKVLSAMECAPTDPDHPVHRHSRILHVQQGTLRHAPVRGPQSLHTPPLACEGHHDPQPSFLNTSACAHMPPSSQVQSPRIILAVLVVCSGVGIAAVTDKVAISNAMVGRGRIVVQTQHYT
jgi:hypothetical protein